MCVCVVFLVFSVQPLAHVDYVTTTTVEIQDGSPPGPTLKKNQHFIYLFIFREKGREGEREGEKHGSVASPMYPDWCPNPQGWNWCFCQI